MSKADHEGTTAKVMNEQMRQSKVREEERLLEVHRAMLQPQPVQPADVAYTGSRPLDMWQLQGQADSAAAHPPIIASAVHSVASPVQNDSLKLEVSNRGSNRLDLVSQAQEQAMQDCQHLQDQLSKVAQVVEAERRERVAIAERCTKSVADLRSELKLVMTTDREELSKAMKVESQRQVASMEELSSEIQTVAKTVTADSQERCIAVETSIRQALAQGNEEVMQELKENTLQLEKSFEAALGTLRAGLADETGNRISELARLADSIETSQGQPAVFQMAVDNLDRKIQNLQGDISDLGAEHQSRHVELKELREVAARTENQTSELQLLQDDFRNQLVVLNKASVQNSEAQTEIRNHISNVSAQESDARKDQQSGLLASLEAADSRLQALIADTKSGIDRHQVSIQEQLERQRQAIADQFEQTHGSIADHMEDVDRRLKSSVSQLSAAQGSQQTSFAGLHKDLERKLRDELADAFKDFHERHAELKDLVSKEKYAREKQTDSIDSLEANLRRELAQHQSLGEKQDAVPNAGVTDKGANRNHIGMLDSLQATAATKIQALKRGNDVRRKAKATARSGVTSSSDATTPKAAPKEVADTSPSQHFYIGDKKEKPEETPRSNSSDDQALDSEVERSKPKRGKLSLIFTTSQKGQKLKKAQCKEFNTELKQKTTAKADIVTEKERKSLRASKAVPLDPDDARYSVIGHAMTNIRNTFRKKAAYDEKAPEESPEKDQEGMYSSLSDSGNEPSPESQIPEPDSGERPDCNLNDKSPATTPQATDNEESTKEEMAEAIEWGASDSDAQLGTAYEESETGEDADEDEQTNEDMRTLRIVFDEAADQHGRVNKGNLSGAMNAAARSRRMRKSFSVLVQEVIRKLPTSHDCSWWEFSAQCHAKMTKSNVPRAYDSCRCGPDSFGATKAAPFCQRCGRMCSIHQVPMDRENISPFGDRDLSQLAWPLLEGGSLSSFSEQQYALKAVIHYVRTRPGPPWPWRGPMSSPLQSAVRFGRVDLAQCLLQEGMKVNEKDEKGVSVLHWAVFDGREKMCQLLLGMSADVNILDPLGQSPLFFAPNRSICRFLLERRADIKCINSNRQSALHLAARGGIIEVYEHLTTFASKSLLQLRDVHGSTARHYAQLGAKSRDLLAGQQTSGPQRTPTLEPRDVTNATDTCSVASGGSSPSTERRSSRQWRQRHEQASREYQAFMSEAAVTDSGPDLQESGSALDEVEDRSPRASLRRLREPLDQRPSASNEQQASPSREPPLTAERNSHRRAALRAPKSKHAQERDSAANYLGGNSVVASCAPFGNGPPAEASLRQSRSSQIERKVIRGGGQRPAATRSDDVAKPRVLTLEAASNVVGPLGMTPIMPPDDGAGLIQKVIDGSWAAEVGIRPGYAICSLNGMTVESMGKAEFAKALKARPLRIVLQPPQEESRATGMSKADQTEQIEPAAPSRQTEPDSLRRLSREDAGAAGPMQHVVAQQAAAQLATAAVATAMALEDAGHSQSTAGVLRQLRNSGIISGLPELGGQEALSATEKRSSGIFEGGSMELELGRGDLAGGSLSRQLQPVQEDSGEAEGSENWSDPGRPDAEDMEPFDLEGAF